MATQKQLLLVCDPAVETSATVREKLVARLPDYGIDVASVTEVSSSDAPREADAGEYHLVVTTRPVDHRRFDIPVAKASALMTGVGEDEALAEIAATLQS